jgi:hypothetical protein
MTFSAVSYVRRVPPIVTTLSEATATPKPFIRINCEVIAALFSEDLFGYGEEDIGEPGGDAGEKLSER